VDPVPDPLLLRKSVSAGNLTRDLCGFQPGSLTTSPWKRSIIIIINNAGGIAPHILKLKTKLGFRLMARSL
jgi:hypothetical protein